MQVAINPISVSFLFFFLRSHVSKLNVTYLIRCFIIFSVENEKFISKSICLRHPHPQSKSDLHNQIFYQCSSCKQLIHSKRHMKENLYIDVEEILRSYFPRHILQRSKIDLLKKDFYESNSQRKFEASFFWFFLSHFRFFRFSPKHVILTSKLIWQGMVG